MEQSKPYDVAKLQSTGAVEGLIDLLLKDPNADVRKDAAEALGELGDVQAVKPLTEALLDHDAFVRMNAASALYDDLDWRPDRSERGAAYWISQEDWQTIKFCIFTIGSWTLRDLHSKTATFPELHSNR